MSASIAFDVLCLCALVSALFVVRSANLIHAVLWLGATLLTTAGLYAMLDASFLAGVQVLVYVGGVITLMIFGVMITRRHEGLLVAAETARARRALVVAAATFAVVAVAIGTTEGLDAAPHEPYTPVTTSDLGRALLGEHILAFEVISFLLLGAIIGAIVIARKHDPEAAPRPRLAARREAASVPPPRPALPDALASATPPSSATGAPS
jgi:NADH-quinone oxidoreductase subunit J